MIVRSWPIVIEVIPLLESELAIDPGSVKVCDKVIDFVHFWGFLLNSLPYATRTKLGGTKQVAAVFCTKLFRIRTPLAALKPGPFAKLLGSSGSSSPCVQQLESSIEVDEGLLEIREN